MGQTQAADALALYRMMRLIRRTEEILIAEYHPANEMRCPMHFCVGQEAAPAALSLQLRPDDVIMSHYRSHGYYLAKGAPLDAMIAEFYGKATGSNGGLAGSMELAHHGFHFYSGAIVGGPLGLAVGSAFAQRYRRGGSGISVAVFGDGAMDEGVSYEALNLAALHRLPILFLCENNRYAAHTPAPARAASHDLIARAAAFGVAVRRMPDKNPLELAAAMNVIVADIREGRGPFLLEVETYRFCGHVGPESDDHLDYRPVAEVDAAKASDPLAAMLRLARAAGVADAALEEVDASCDEQVWSAIRAAKAAPFPRFQDLRGIEAANGYAPVVRELIDAAPTRFLGGQAETRLRPY